MADVVGSSTQIATTKNDLITGLVQKELKFTAKLASRFIDVSQFAQKGMKSISFPKLTSFTVAERASGVAGDATPLADSVDKLDLNIPAYLAWLYDPNDVVQSTVAWYQESAKRAGAAHGRYFDAKVIAELKNIATNLGAATVITRDIILAMRKYLRLNFADFSQCVLMISPDQEEAMLKIDEFTRADVYGSSNIPNGVIGRVYGIEVMVHEGLSAADAIMAERAALAYGFQLGPSFSEQPANEFGATAMRAAMDQLYGVKGLQIAQGTALAGKSALAVMM